MNATRASAARANANGTGDTAKGHVHPPIVNGSFTAHQPRVRPSMRPNTSDPKSTTDSTAPTRSMRPREPSRDSLTAHSTPMMMRMPRGTLMPNAHRHENAVVSHPPRSGPTAAMPPIVEPQTAKAMPRSRPRKVAFSSDRVLGSIIAPPTPCTRRAPINRSAVGAKAAPTDAAAKSTTPISSSRRRPNRSARLPNSSSSEAKTRVYASCTHCTWVDERSSSSTIAGTATLTMVESTMMSATARLMKTSPNQRTDVLSFTNR